MVVLRGCIELDTVFFMKGKHKKREKKLEEKLDFYMKLKSQLLPLMPS